MTLPTPTRRGFLRAGAVGGAAALAGCSTGLLGGPSEPPHRTWTYEPTAVGFERRGADFAYVEPGPLAERFGLGEAFFAAPMRRFGSATATIDVDFADLDWLLFSHGYRAVAMQGGFDAEAVRRDLTAKGWTAGDEYRGFRLLESTEDTTVTGTKVDTEGAEDVTLPAGPAAAGLDGDTLLAGRWVAPGRDDPTPIVEAQADAGRAGEGRAVDGNDDFATLVEHLGTGAYCNASFRGDAASPGTEGVPGKHLAQGVRLRPGSEKSKFRYVLVYEARDEIDVAYHREYLGAIPGADDVTVEKRERAVVADASVANEDARSLARL